MYNCPHCNEGPFNVADWWDHMESHRDPKDLQRTDLGYGEDIQGMTTVPTHDMPNEPGFNPEKFGANWIDRDEVWEQYPDASEYNDVHEGSHPFMYDPDNDSLHMGPKGSDHMSLFYKIPNYLDPPSMVWGRYFPHHQSVDIFEGNTPEEGQAAVDHITRKFGSWKEGSLPDVPLHKIVWLSQPNNTSLKYWHHTPSNTTYAWDATGGSQTTKTHHLDAADDIAANHGGNHPLGSPAWEGGFYEQNGMGRHPADLWGLPSQVDYAPVQGGY